MSEQALIPVPKAASDYSIARSLIDEAIRKSDLRVHQVGRSKLLEREQFETWIKNGGVSAPRKAPK